MIHEIRKRCEWILGWLLAGLDFNEDVDQGDGGWGYAGDAAGLGEGAGADAG
jgi:hypothetical protein